MSERTVNNYEEKISFQEHNNEVISPRAHSSESHSEIGANNTVQASNTLEISGAYFRSTYSPRQVGIVCSCHYPPAQMKDAQGLAETAINAC